jgi:hypothetical protein
MLHITPILLALAVTQARGQVEVPLEDPVQLTADGAPIDVGADIGHAGPQLRDHDGDGKPDLLVSTFRGTIHVFANVGTVREPRFERRGHVALAGEDEVALKFHNW